MSFTFVANTSSEVTVDPQALIESVALDARDYAATIEWDLNALFSTLMVPNLPQTDANGETDHIEQDTFAGSSYSAFSDLFRDNVKKGWSESIVVSDTETTQRKLNDIIRLVIRHLVDPTAESLLDPDGDITVDDGDRFNISSEKVKQWLQYGAIADGDAYDSAEDDFSKQVFTQDQVTEVLRQIRDLQKYVTMSGADYGKLDLAVGDSIGVIVNLKTDTLNELTFHLYVQQSA